MDHHRKVGCEAERFFLPVIYDRGGTNQNAVYHVTPDYLAIGSDQDYFLCPMTPLLGQRISDRRRV